MLEVLISFLVLFCFGCLTGITTVLFGFGGGFVTVPVVFGFVVATSGSEAMHVAVATSTAVMIVNSVSATLAQARAGRLRRDYLWPLVLFISVGAVFGSLLAGLVPDGVLHLLFVAYLAIAIVDGLFRSGFLGSRDRAVPPRPLGRATTTAGGTGIGAVAALLGVGGSVLTVPLLRRRGFPMADAAAMANPLSVPIALAGTAVYAFGSPAVAVAGRIGFVDLLAAAALLCGSLPAIAVTKRVTGRIPDRVHAGAYLVLLVVVLISMVITGA